MRMEKDWDELEDPVETDLVLELVQVRDRNFLLDHLWVAEVVNHSSSYRMDNSIGNRVGSFCNSSVLVHNF